MQQLLALERKALRLAYQSAVSECWHNRRETELLVVGRSGALSSIGFDPNAADKQKRPPMTTVRRSLRLWQMVCKPGSVELLSQSGRSFLYEHNHSCSLAAYPRCLDRGGHLSPHIWPCSSWGLPCHSCCHECGGLLPHRFTLAVPKNGGLFSVALSVTSDSRLSCPGVTWQPVHRSPDFPRIGIS